MEIQIWVTKTVCKVSWISVFEVTLQEKVYRKEMLIWVIMGILEAVLMEKHWLICM